MIKADPERVADLCTEINKVLVRYRTIDGLDALMQVTAYLISRTGEGSEYNEEKLILAHKDLTEIIHRYLDLRGLQ